MPTFSRHDKTGRSTGKLMRKEGRLISPPKGESWIWLPLELLRSDAWQGMSIHCRKFLDFLCVEHCNHAGLQNGGLQATYDQLAKAGLSRKRISNAIREADARGLVRVMRQGGLYGLDARRTTSLYRLTWIGTITPQGYATNEWKKFVKKKKFRVPHVGTVQKPEKRREVA